MSPEELAALRRIVTDSTQELWQLEVQVTGLELAELRALAKVLLEAEPADVPSVRNSDELQDVLIALHHAIARLAEPKIAESRKQKRKRKRHVLQAAVSGTAGAGMITANTMVPPLMPLSYALSIASLVQASRDLLEAAEQSD
ncbi:MAG TPA: hypothetical protein VHA79_09210 [Mycobacteriales bacterium]|nr:hypothetical protein [Mycobacteriales bacterium]